MKAMRCCRRLTCWSVLAALCGFDESLAQNRMIKAELAETDHSLGESIVVKLTFENPSGADDTWWIDEAWHASYGGTIGLVIKWKRNRGATSILRLPPGIHEPYDRRDREIQPSASETVFAVLSDWHTILMPGEYTISFTCCRIPVTREGLQPLNQTYYDLPAWGPEFTSNPVTLRVHTPDEKSYMNTARRYLANTLQGRYSEDEAFERPEDNVFAKALSRMTMESMLPVLEDLYHGCPDAICRKYALEGMARVGSERALDAIRGIEYWKYGDELLILETLSYFFVFGDKADWWGLEQGRSLFVRFLPDFPAELQAKARLAYSEVMRRGYTRRVFPPSEASPRQQAPVRAR